MRALQRLKARAAAAGVTPSVVILSAFSQVLAYWSKTPWFTVNVTVNNRLPLHPQIDAVVGNFTQIELLEVDLRERQTLQQLATAIESRLWQDLEHQHFNGVRVLRELARLRRETLLAPVVFTSALGIDIDAMSDIDYLITQTPQVLLDHQVVEVNGELVLSWDTVKDAFPSGMLDDMFGAYCQYLEAIVDKDGLWDGTAEYEWLPAHHKADRVKANTTATPWEDQLLHAGFLMQATRAPGQMALKWSDGTMTYEELAQRAGQLARRLTALGAEPGSFVGVSLPKGWQQIVTVIGVLMSGAGYLPIDPELPQTRRRLLIEHGRVNVLVTAQDEAARWPDGLAHVVVGDQTGETVSVWDGGARQSPADLAYLLYTSGSTGIPKGVAVTHRAAWNTVRALNEHFGIGPADSVLSLSSLSFDLSVYDMFGVLAAGGTMILPDPRMGREPRHWLELCQAHQVTIWHSVPALMEMAVEQSHAGPALPASLRLVFMGGDWISVTLPQRIRAFAQAAHVVAFGGTTEASIHSTVFPADDADPTWDSIPYGKPLPNQVLEVLDERLEPRPVHVPGDLYIGGTGLAQGYWQDEERTAASFISCPRTGKRLYRTGDLARYLPNGDVEFLGREDSQVKIGGYRIELGEIETQLAACESVQAAAVAAVEDPQGSRRLVAFVVPRRESGDAEETAVSPAAEITGAANGDTPGPIVDPMKRFEFKMRRHGLRRLEQRPGVDLPSPRTREAHRALSTARKSHRSFGLAAVSLQAIATLLEALRSAEDCGLPKYRYGSAGGLYPVQTYVGVGPGRVDGVPGGTYYYDPEMHTLRAISAAVPLDAGVHASTNKELVARAAFAIVLVADLGAIEPLYGDKAERFSVIEAGLMAQLLEMEAIQCGLGLCQVGLTDTPVLHQMLELTESHMVLHGLVGGRRAGDVGTETGPALAGELLWAELREHLTSSLPDYMVPRQFVALDQLPLTGNGKVDRRALPGLIAADGIKSTTQGGTVSDALTAEKFSRRLSAAPAGGRRTIALEVVRSEVAAVLGHASPRTIDADTPFSELGLESLHAVRLRNRLETVTGLGLPTTMIFDHPTPRLVAERVLEDSAGSDGAEAGSVEDELDSDLAEATPESILALVDKELGGS